jgi:hypothetical protein
MSRWITKDAPGVRFVFEQPPVQRYKIEWRHDWWSALEESRRRNAIIFATFHWDG